MNINLNLDTDIDLNIKKLDEMLEKIKLLEDKSKMINFITIAEFAKIRGCSIATAQAIFNLPDFCSEDFRKRKSSFT